VYAVADRLENVRLTINEKLEKRSDSYPLDAVHVADREVCGEYWATEQVIHYPVVVGVSMVPESLTTAGEYADLLNDYLYLQPGAYVCRIVSFDIQTAGGERRTVYTPALSVPLEVEENKASVFLGDFEVEIK
jgi:hypothetical protein